MQHGIPGRQLKAERRTDSGSYNDRWRGADKYSCKYCGEIQAALSFLTGGFCAKSPNRRHQPYKGTHDYVSYDCKYCGHPHITIALLTKGPCEKSPSGYHQPYEGEKQDKYFCKYCGSSSRSIERLTRGSCSASPNRHHQPAE